MRESLQLFLPLSCLLLPSSGYLSTILLTEFAAYPSLCSSQKGRTTRDYSVTEHCDQQSGVQNLRDVSDMCVWHCTTYVLEKGKFLKENISQLTGDMDKQNYRSAMIRYLSMDTCDRGKDIFKIFMYQFVTQMLASGI